MDKAKEISALWKQIKPQVGELVRLCHEVESHAEVTADAYQRGYKAGREVEKVKQRLRQPDLEQVRKEAYDKGYTDAAYNCHERCAFLDDAKEEAYQRGYETAKHECEDCQKIRTDAEQELADKAYQKGLSDVWDAARRVVALSTVDRRKVFGSEYMYSILEKHTASEAIEKLKAYEQEQNEIQVGDEVITASGKAVVMGVGPVHFEYVYADGSTGYDEVKNVKKTGRHFHEIVSVLQKMKEA